MEKMLSIVAHPLFIQLNLMLGPGDKKKKRNVSFLPTVCTLVACWSWRPNNPTRKMKSKGSASVFLGQVIEGFTEKVGEV